MPRPARERGREKWRTKMRRRPASPPTRKWSTRKTVSKPHRPPSRLSVELTGTTCRGSVAESYQLERETRRLKGPFGSRSAAKVKISPATRHSREPKRSSLRRRDASTGGKPQLASLPSSATVVDRSYRVRLYHLRKDDERGLPGQRYRRRVSSEFGALQNTQRRRASERRRDGPEEEDQPCICSTSLSAPRRPSLRPPWGSSVARERRRSCWQRAPGCISFGRTRKLAKPSRSASRRSSAPSAASCLFD